MLVDESYNPSGGRWNSRLSYHVRVAEHLCILSCAVSVAISLVGLLALFVLFAQILVLLARACGSIGAEKVLFAV